MGFDTLVGGSCVGERANGLYASETWAGVWNSGPVKRVESEPPEGADLESSTDITSSVPVLKILRM